jgi:RNA polymerase sigma-70 factor (ECF subfamily)
MGRETGFSPELAAALDELCARACREVPELDFDRDAFLGHVAGLWGTAPEILPELAHLHAGDLWLASRCLVGVPEARELFFRRHRPAIFQAVRGVRPMATLLEDIAQQIAEILFVGSGESGPRLATYTGRGALSRWLAVAANRLALMHLRAERSATRTREAAAAEAALIAGTDLDVQLLRQRYQGSFEQALASALAAVPARSRVALSLYFVSGLSVDRIAAIQNVSQSTVSRWLAAARSTIVDRTRDALMLQLGVSRREFESIAAVLLSDLDVSLSRLLQA